jgi:hypothetical protein
MKIMLGPKVLLKIGDTLRGLLAFVTKEPLPRRMETTLRGKPTGRQETRATSQDDKGDAADRS